MAISRELFLQLPRQVQRALLDRAENARWKRDPLRWTRAPGAKGLTPFSWTPKQLEAFELARGKKLFGFLAGNRVGKSVWAARALVCNLLGIDPLRLGELPPDPAAWALGPPRVAWAITVTFQKSVDAQQRAIAACVPPCLLRSRYHEGTGFPHALCVFANGSRIVFKTPEQALDTFESNPIHVAWCDENLPLSYIRATMVRLVDYRGPLWITVWPGYKDIVDLCTKGIAAAGVGGDDAIPESDRAYLFAEMLDNPHLSPAEIAVLEKVLPAHERLARVKGRPTQTRGLVYGDYRENLHCETFEPPLPADWTLYEAIDPGWANPCAVLFAAVDPQGVLHCYDEIYERYRTVGEIAAMIFLRRWLNRGLMLPAEVEQFQQLTKFDAFAEDPEEQIRRDAKLLGVVQQWRARKGDCKPRMVVIDEAGKQRDQAKPVSVLRQFERFGIRPELAKNADKDGQRDMVRERLRPMDGLIRLKLAWRMQWLRYELTRHRFAEPDEASEQYVGDRETVVKADNHLLSGLEYLCAREPRWVPPPPPAPPRGSILAREAREQAAGDDARDYRRRG